MNKMLAASSPSRGSPGTTTTTQATQSLHAPVLSQAHSRSRQRRQRLLAAALQDDECADGVLPKELLDLVLLHLAADDPISLVAAGCAHPNLHDAIFTSMTAAVQEARSVKMVLPHQHKMYQLSWYLGKYGQYLERIDLTGTRSREGPGWIRFNVCLPQLPYNILHELRSLSLTNVRLQLLPGDEYQGVLGSVVPDLTQLQINSCKVMEEMNDLAEALLGLTNLQHLSMGQNYVGGTERRFPLPIVAIGTLQKLTYLVLAGHKLQDAEGLRHLQALTNLVHLGVSGLRGTIRASTLSKMRSLKYLKVTPGSDPDDAARFCSSGVFEPGALAGKTQLQHVELRTCSIAGGSEGITELLYIVQHMDQTTSLIVSKPPSWSDASYVTLNADMQQQTVSIRGSLSPQQVLGITVQFPHLRVLQVNICCQGRESCDELQDADALRHLTSLEHLELCGLQANIRASTLSEMRSLKYLKVTPYSESDQTKEYCSSGVFEPGALAGKTQLQHVELNCSIDGGTAGVANLLYNLQHMTHTSTFTVNSLKEPLAPSWYPCNTSYASLRASMQRQTVSIYGKLSPQQVFSTAKQFRHLRALEVDVWCQGHSPCFNTSNLVSSCRGLQRLMTPGFVYGAGEVALLSGLSSLTKLGLCPDKYALDGVCQLRQLRHLDMRVPSSEEGEGLQLLRELTKLQQLTCLDFHAGDSRCYLTAAPAGKRSMSQEVLLHISSRDEAQRLKQVAQQGPKSSSGLGATTQQQGRAGHDQQAANPPTTLPWLRTSCFKRRVSQTPFADVSMRMPQSAQPSPASGHQKEAVQGLFDEDKMDKPTGFTLQHLMRPREALSSLLNRIWPERGG